VYRQFSGGAPEWSGTASKAWCAACALQSAWTVAFAYEVLPVSTVLIGGIVASTGVVYTAITEDSVTAAPALLNGTLGFGM
jgi:hypothetical protein